MDGYPMKVMTRAVAENQRLKEKLLKDILDDER
jgi:hypothetical protein